MINLLTKFEIISTHFEKGYQMLYSEILVKNCLFSPNPPLFGINIGISPRSLASARVPGYHTVLFV